MKQFWRRDLVWSRATDSYAKWVRWHIAVPFPSHELLHWIRICHFKQKDNIYCLEYIQQHLLVFVTLKNTNIIFCKRDHKTCVQFASCTFHLTILFWKTCVAKHFLLLDIATGWHRSRDIFCIVIKCRKAFSPYKVWHSYTLTSLKLAWGNQYWWSIITTDAIKKCQYQMKEPHPAMHDMTQSLIHVL